jgi:hypothetical protein
VHDHAHEVCLCACENLVNQHLKAGGRLMGDNTTHAAFRAHRHPNSAMEELLESFIFHCKDASDGDHAFFG